MLVRHYVYAFIYVLVSGSIQQLRLCCISRNACFPGAWPPALSVPGDSPPWASSRVPSPPGLWKSIFCPRWASTMMGWTTTFPRRSCLTLVLCPPEDLDCLQGAWRTLGPRPFSGTRLLGYPQLMPSIRTPNRDINPWGFTTQAFFQHGWTLGHGSLFSIFQGLSPRASLPSPSPTGHSTSISLPPRAPLFSAGHCSFGLHHFGPFALRACSP
jgi:hypothetical protein